MPRSIPSKRNSASALPALAAFLLVSALCACSRIDVREERYADGAIKAESAYLLASGQAPLRHGLQMAWYPDGGKESLEVYVAGYRQGYSLRWHRNGKMKSLEHFTDGNRDGQARFWDEAGRIIAGSAPAGADCALTVTSELPTSCRFAITP